MTCSGLDGAACRNPLSMLTEPWCYVAEPPFVDLCAVPSCSQAPVAPAMPCGSANCIALVASIASIAAAALLLLAVCLGLRFACCRRVHRQHTAKVVAPETGGTETASVAAPACVSNAAAGSAAMAPLTRAQVAVLLAQAGHVGLRYTANDVSHVVVELAGLPPLAGDVTPATVPAPPEAAAPAPAEAEHTRPSRLAAWPRRGSTAATAWARARPETVLSVAECSTSPPGSSAVEESDRLRERWPGAATGVPSAAPGGPPVSDSDGAPPCLPSAVHAAKTALAR